MSAAILTLFLCCITGISRVFLKKGIESSNHQTAMVYSLVIGVIVLGIATATSVPAADFNWAGIGFFALIGMVAPPLVRSLTYIGVDRLGASRSDPVRSLTPFFAILFAAIFLGEVLTLPVILGASLIFAGVVMISRRSKSDTSKPWKSSDLLFPLAAALLAGVVASSRKYGSSLLPSSILAATAAACSGALVYGLYMLFTGSYKKITLDRRSGTYFLLAGLCTSATDVLDILVLKMGKVMVVSPLLASSPLFVILFSHLFLKDVEKITPMLLIGALIIFGGIQVIMNFAT